MSSEVTLIKCSKCGRYYEADVKHYCQRRKAPEEYNPIELKDFVDYLERVIMETAKEQLLESDITYIDLDRNDEFDITVKLGCCSSLTALQFEIGKLPAGMPIWKEDRIKQRIREEWAIVAQCFKTGNIEALTGVFSFLLCMPWESEE